MWRILLLPTIKPNSLSPDWSKWNSLHLGCYFKAHSITMMLTGFTYIFSLWPFFLHLSEWINDCFAPSSLDYHQLTNWSCSFDHMKLFRILPCYNFLERSYKIVRYLFSLLNLQLIVKVFGDRECMEIILFLQLSLWNC